MLLEFLFWLSLFLVFYTYVWYPERMVLRAKKYQNKKEEMEEWPHIALLLAAYNEEAVIEEKIRTSLETTYPAHKIRLIIGSDRSSDNTDAIVREWAEKDSRVQLVRFEERTGKPQIINKLAAKCEAEILVLSDADTYFEPEMLKTLVAAFKEEKVGGVQARFITEADPKMDVSMQELLYNDRELQIKKGQSVNGAVIGAYGACYALRSKLYAPVPKGFLVDDFYLFMKVLEQGYQTVYSEDAACRLEVSGESKTEFKRKARIGVGNYQNFFRLKAFWNPFKNTASRYYWSHKVLRWFTPFLLLVILFSNMALIQESERYQIFFLLQLIGYATWPVDFILKKSGIDIRLLRFGSHFLRMNVALLLGFFRYLKGGSKGTW